MRQGLGLRVIVGLHAANLVAAGRVWPCPYNDKRFN